MYSFSYLEPVCCSVSSSNCCFLTCIQVSQEACQVVWYSHLFQNYPQFIVIDTVKGFGIVNRAEIEMFFWNSLAFLMIQWMLAIWSVVPLPFLNPAWTSGNSWFIVETWLGVFWTLLCYGVRWVQLCSSLSILWHCLSLELEWKLTFFSPVATVEFSKFADILSAALSQHHLSGFEIAQLEFHHLH